ncbi:MBL fold metallo-hydrolase [Ruegeria halocynthiae]|uniref:MBL fold metallo-hydrolase n=1 Tax=Ruegeria halocynthiae TaxID=985054 RepID=UPI0005626923|nr:MBL fold metallo-hydrolase [Ruegeria halocynthiae]
MATSTSNLRVFEPTPYLLAFYDGRIEGTRLHSVEPNWLDDGAYSLGFASYVIVDQGEALVYDTSISIEHAQAIRDELERRGVTSIRVVLSHHHMDHVAGTAVFSDCEIIASAKTAQALRDEQDAFARSSPPIAPVVMPTTVFDGELKLTVGGLDVELRPLDIHSFDGLTIYLPETRLLLAGDTLEDTVTYVAEPDRLDVHLAEIDRLSNWDIQAIFPNHGTPDRIASGGYETSFIAATRAYVEKLLRCRNEPELGSLTLSEFIAPHIESGVLIYFEPYEQVHKWNVRSVLAT